jgi:threonine aldolase
VANQPDGKLALEDIEAAVRSDNVHFPRTRLIILENTHNLCNGFPLDTNYMRAVGEIAERYNLKIHVDGARFFNAAVALDIDPKDLAAEADSVSFCLSKGLGAPVGSVVCGTQDFIHEARRARKVLGGGMRQAGVIAAAGIVALNEMVDRLADDHANAKKLATGLAQSRGYDAGGIRAANRCRGDSHFAGANRAKCPQSRHPLSHYIRRYRSGPQGRFKSDEINHDSWRRTRGKADHMIRGWKPLPLFF